MKSKFSKVTLLILLLAFVVTTMLVPTSAFAATSSTRPTNADEVEYVTSGNYRYNWGVRGETATFLSKHAQEFYTGNYTWENLSKVGGGSSQSNAPSSDLYKELKTLMSSKHTHQTSYQETRYQYKYTDCEKSNKDYISSFYSGVTISNVWDSGKTWNREHTWPNSKGLNGNDENDIMMLRPTATSENSSRGNTAYGQSSGYYNPDCENPPASLKGDVARICLYVYTRWGNTGRMWGSSGVMESLNVLLQWMEEDPVDTWEMGRNDACESITGSRNVFIDYPEYAWLLFGKNVPENYSTPSSNSGTVAPDPDIGGDGGNAGGDGGNTGDGGSTTTPVETVHEGTQSDPYTVADAIAVGSSVAAGGNSSKSYIKGNVVSIEENNGTYLKNVIITDSSTSETLRCYTLNPNSAADLELKAGDTILIYGYIRVYKGEIEIGSNPDDKTDYAHFSIVTDSTGGDGGSTGGTTTPDEKVTAFKTAVANISSATTISAKFDAIKTAVTAYNGLTSTQKQQVSSEIATLKTAISNYNDAITTQNGNSNNALNVVLQTVVATAVALAVAIITKKVLF